MKKSFYLACSILLGSLLISACSTSYTPINTDALEGKWLVEYIEQRPVLDHSPAHFVFDKTNRVSGSSSCNRIMAGYTLTSSATDTAFSFSQAAGTMMMCPEVLMEQERRFLAAMTKVKTVKIEQGLLIFSDEDNQLIFKASKQ